MKVVIAALLVCVLLVGASAYKRTVRYDDQIVVKW